MKKFISVLMIAAMVMMLAVPAFAADEKDGNSVPAPADEVTAIKPEVGDAVDANGEKVDVVVKEPEKTAEQLKEAVTAAVDAAEDAGLDIKDAVASEVFEIEQTDGEQPGSPVTVTFVRDSKSGEIAAVMYQAEDGSWDSAKFKDNKDGTVTIVFEHFCTVVLLVKAPDQAPDVKPAPDTTETPSSESKGPTSPQTGYD